MCVDISARFWGFVSTLTLPQAKLGFALKYVGVSFSFVYFSSQDPTKGPWAFVLAKWLGNIKGSE